MIDFANNDLIIKTPRGQIVQVETKNGVILATLEWNSNFGNYKTADFNKAQKFVDSEVLRYCDPLIPFKTGMLKLSGKLGTFIGSGEVRYIAPYAKKQYKTAESRPYDAHRGGYWFERMKISHRTAILRGAAKISGGKA